MSVEQGAEHPEMSLRLGTKLHRLGFKKLFGYDHRLGRRQIFLKVRRRYVALISSVIGIDLEEMEPVGVVLFRNRVDCQNALLQTELL